MSNYAGFTVLGASSQNDRAGSSVTNIGDINGDGLADFAVSAPSADAPYNAYYGEGFYNRYNGGAVYVVFGDEDTDGDGPDTGLPTSINVEDLDGTNGFRINPDGDLFDRFAFYDAGFGVNVTALGDVNGDGVDDFGIAQSATNYISYYGGGFYGEYGPQTPDGVAYVILGGQDFEAEQEVDDLAGFRIDTEDRVQEIVALGDVNGDGFADVGLNTYNRQTGYTYIDYTYLSDFNGNGVYDAYDPDTFPYFENYYSGSARVNQGTSTSYVIFGTDQERVSDDPIAQSGNGFGIPVLTNFEAPVVPEDAPTAGETIVDATQLDGSDGFSINTGDILTQTDNFSEFGYGYFGSSYGIGGIAGAGDINGDGINDIIATERGYYSPLLNSGDTLTIVRDANTGEVTFTPADYTTTDSTTGNFVIFGNAPGDSFQSEISFLSASHPDVDLQTFFDFERTVQGIGDVSGNDNLDELAFAEFLSSTQVARDVDGNLLRDADGNLIFEDNPDSPFDIFTSGIAIINGTAGDFLSDGTATNRVFDFGDLINGQGSFVTDTSSQIVRNFDTGEVSTQGVFIEDGPGQIAGIGDINNDGIEDFAFVARRTDQVEDEIPIFLDDEGPGTTEVIQRNASQDVVYLVFGQADPLTGIIDLADTFDSSVAADERLAFRIEGLQSSFFFTEFDRDGPTETRVNVSGGGDINGDDISDIVIGSPGTDGPGFDDGAAFVVFGGLDALAAADAADGQSDGVINTANLGVNVETGVLPITVSLRDAGFFSRFQSEGDVGATPFTFEVTRSGDLSEEVSFDFTVTPSGFDPTEAEDFVGGAFPFGTVTFADGADTALVTVEVQGDFVQEGTEDFTVTISNATTDGPSPISINGDTTFARIFNDDQPVRFFAGNGSVTEGDVDADNRELILTVTRSGETQVEASVDFEIQLSTAELDDFEPGTLPLSGTLEFGVGDTSQQIVLPIAEDTNIEGNEQVRLLLSNAASEAPAGSPAGTVIPAIISDSIGVGTIFTDDFAVEFRVSNAFVDEGDDASDNRELVFTVTRSGNLVPEAQVDLSFVTASFNAADANDFEVDPFGTQTLVFGTGQQTQTIRLAIDEDVDIEANERIDARLSNQQLTDGTTNDVLIRDGFGVGTINNDDFPPRISVEGGGSFFEGTGSFGTTTATFEITRTGDTQGITDVTFDLNPRPAPGDFFAADSQDISGISIDGTPVPGSGFLPLFGQTVRFEDGESVKTVTVDIVRDGIVEPREQFELRITEVDALNGTDYDIFTPVRVATILNDDGRPAVIPPGVEADVFGDPHIVTLDGLGYDFQATGEYILVETLDGATNPFQVQVRFEPLPGSDLVSTTTRMAVQFGDATLEIDALGTNPLLITDAGGTTRTPTVEELALGTADINGDGVQDVFFDAALSEFTIVLNDQGEQLQVKNMDGTLNVCVFLADSATGNQGNVRGLMGDADGTGDTTDDLALREGTVVPAGLNLLDINGDPVPEGTPLTADTALPQPVDFDTLYGIYAISWNLDGTNGKDRFFSDAAVPRDPDFPAALLTIEDLPADVRAAAEAAVLAAQDPDDPLDPAIFEAAVLDFALTGNPDFISGALGLAAEQTDETEPENAPDLPVTVSVSADPTGLTEGDAGSQSVVFTFNRLDDASVPLSISYEIGGTADANDVAEGTDFAGTIDFAEDETTQTITIEVLGDLLTEDDETLIATITDAGDALIAGATAEVIISTDDFAPEAQDDAFSTDEVTRIDGDVFTDNQVEDPADNADSDADNDDLTVIALNGGVLNPFAAVTLDSGARLALREDGTFSYDPFGVVDGSDPTDGFAFLDAGDVATDSFTYTVSDGNGGTDTATVEITIQGVNNAPDANLDFVTLTEDDGSITAGLLDNDVDPETVGDEGGSDLRVTQIALGSQIADVDADGATLTLANGATLTVDADGNAEFELNGAFQELTDVGGDNPNDVVTFSYTIADRDGLEDTTLFQVHVDGVNDGPVAVDDFAETDEDTPITIDVLENDFDVDTANIGINGTFSPDNGSVNVDVDGNIVYTPDDDFFGTDVFQYSLSDGQVSVLGTVTVTVNAVNDLPDVLSEATVDFDEDDNPIIITPEDLINPEVVQDVDNDLVELSAFALTCCPTIALNGDDIRTLEGFEDFEIQITSTISGPDTIWTIAPGQFEFLGRDDVLTFEAQYRITDVSVTEALEDLESLSVLNTVLVTINGENDAPEAEDQDLETNENTPLFIDPLANASDVDGDDLQVGDILTVVGGQAIFVDGGIEFTPNDGFTGTASVTYEITDGLETIQTTANVTVNNVNDAPEAADDSDEIGESGQSFLNLLSNDSDPDGDALSILDVNGVTTPNEAFDVTSAGGRTGSVFFVPVGESLNFAFDTDGGFEDLARDETDTVTLSYTVSDGTEQSTAEVEITINGENDAPKIVSGAAFSLVENTTAVGTVLAEDIDTSDVLEFSIIGGADADLFEINASTGALNFIDAPDFEAAIDTGGIPDDNVYEVEVSVGDGDETDTQVISVTVENDPDDEGGDDPLVIEGTEGSDRLIGTGADEIFRALGGAVDIMAGGGGSDTFEFGDEVDNGVREFTYILDFDGDDFLDLNGTGFQEFNFAGRTYLVLEGDGDIALLFSTPDFDETTQLL
ncbi:MAG: Ig-like domain-containing protein [Pseudomonadota bacterium]